MGEGGGGREIVFGGKCWDFTKRRDESTDDKQRRAGIPVLSLKRSSFRKISLGTKVEGVGRGGLIGLNVLSEKRLQEFVRTTCELSRVWIAILGVAL